MRAHLAQGNGERCNQGRGEKLYLGLGFDMLAKFKEIKLAINLIWL